MTQGFERSRRVADVIHRELASALIYEVRDPRMKEVNISGVRVSKDLSYATVYVLCGSDAEQIKETVAQLNKASGFFRTIIADQMSLRTVPTLKFVYDEAVSRGIEITSLIDQAMAIENSNDS